MKCLKKIHKELGLIESRWPVKKTMHFIGKAKEKMLRADQIAMDGNPYTETMVSVYKVYEKRCRLSALVDFNELMLAVYEKFQQQPEFLREYQQRFKHILVDEFQDTNELQYAWIRSLVTPDNRVMVVGDDDQSIYSWRGANLTHVFSFEQDFSPVKVVRLEQNYRSTQNILSAANAVIGHNINRMGKQLWTDGSSGECLQLYYANHEYDEAEYLSGEAERWFSDGGNYDDIAILYRSNAQSRVIEEVFTRRNIPFRVYGGLRFFERAEIKDVLAYLRLMVNRMDDAAFERIINHPPRGIGQVSLGLVRDYARQNQISMWDSLQQLLLSDDLTGRSKQAFKQFVDLMDELSPLLDRDIAAFAETVVSRVELLQHYKKEPGDRGEFRVDNIQELISAMGQYRCSSDANPMLSFLSDIALDAGDGQASSQRGVRLMTLHAAKGLEFPLVLLVGMEEGLFPHKMSSFDADQIEEERRLCYVGMTRAMRRLVLTVSEVRRLHGQENYQRPSRFLGEIPGELIETVRLSSRPSTMVTPTSPAKSSEASPYHLGLRVRHHKFGEGVVLNYDSTGSGRVQVRFYEVGVKWLACEFAVLERIVD